MLRGGLAVASLLALALTGCGGGGATRFSGEGADEAGGGGRLELAVSSLPDELDPLHAGGTSQLMIVRQLFEPLVARQAPPYEIGEASRGVALDWGHSADLRIWRFRLRPGVEFQDGSRLDADAVVTNAVRWRTDPAGIALLPGLVAADAPNPALVRLVFASPVRRLPGLLADPRLGLVSPLGLSPSSGVGAGLARPSRAGSGAFELRRRSASGLSLGRFRRWWGSELRLGPALDALVFRVEKFPAGRAKALQDGQVRVALELPPLTARLLSQDPLIAVLGAGSPAALAYERSVKGVESAQPAALSGAWLALLEQTG
jgi:peptide/nickel transport system substrate-binding protein